MILSVPALIGLAALLIADGWFAGAVAGWCAVRVWVGRMCQHNGNGAMPVNAS